MKKYTDSLGGSKPPIYIEIESIKQIYKMAKTRVNYFFETPSELNKELFEDIQAMLKGIEDEKKLEYVLDFVIETVSWFEEYGSFAIQKITEARDLPKEQILNGELKKIGKAFRSEDYFYYEDSLDDRVKKIDILRENYDANISPIVGDDHELRTWRLIFHKTSIKLTHHLPTVHNIARNVFQEFYWIKEKNTEYDMITHVAFCNKAIEEIRAINKLNRELKNRIVLSFQKGGIKRYLNNSEDSIEFNLKPFKNNPWITGGFYLFALVILLILIAVISSHVPVWVLPIVLISGILSLTIIGAYQLRNDDKLSEESFLRLMDISLKNLPLLRKLWKKKEKKEKNSENKEIK
ncbi:MAG TPA: hypothetical protein DCR93_30575 [Cytophagales bacterium]|nr:hypothetical protein [Cytophagales bacterium]